MIVIGDGELTGRMSLEALNHGSNQIKIIFLLNDNYMNICKNIGLMNMFLSKLKVRRKYIFPNIRLKHVHLMI